MSETKNGIDENPNMIKGEENPLKKSDKERLGRLRYLAGSPQLHPPLETQAISAALSQ
jgi:hypothetical protein